MSNPADRAASSVVSSAVPLVSEGLRFRTAHPVNAMTVDVEDYFQVSAFEAHVDRERWDSIECRIPRNVDRILEIFGDNGVRATFFTLGWVAQRYPDLVRRVSDAGHEVASHGMSHVRVVNQNPSEFRGDVVRSKALLEDTTGKDVLGYRAASYSIGENNLWALDVLAEAGFRYSSSIYPIHHDLYGMPSAPRFAFRLRRDGLLELPVTTVEVLNAKLPCGGGGYFRLFPYWLSRWALRRVNRRDAQPGIFYFHPWEIDPDQPRMPGMTLKTRIRHYVNLRRMESKLIRLLRDFDWDRMDRVFRLDGAAA